MFNLLLIPQVLAKTLATLHEDKVVDKDDAFLPVKCCVLNPKSVSPGELYGEYRETSEWRDGILSKIMRDCVTDFNGGSECRKWIILDGPVDALWIEVDLGPLDS
jgi:dynein heavy chain, axonemal